jgi:hypothetical protein
MEDTVKLSKSEQKIQDKYTYALGEYDSHIYHNTQDLLKESNGNKQSPNQQLLVDTNDIIRSQIMERLTLIHDKSPKLPIEQIKVELAALSDPSKRHPLVMLSEFEKIKLEPKVIIKNNYSITDDSKITEPQSISNQANISMDKSIANKLQNLIDNYKNDLAKIHNYHQNEAIKIEEKYPKTSFSKYAQNDLNQYKAHMNIVDETSFRMQLMSNDLIDHKTDEFKKEVDFFAKAHNTEPLLLSEQINQLPHLPRDEQTYKQWRLDEVNMENRIYEGDKIVENLPITEKQTDYINGVNKTEIDKSIKIPDRNEIAQNPNKFEAEKGIDNNGVNEAPAKSINTIAEDYIKGQEKAIQERISLADHFSEKENKISHKR